MINLDQLQSTSVPYPVYCSTGKHIVHKQGGSISFSDCHGIQNQLILSYDDRQYEYAETPSFLVFVFSGRTVVVVSKDKGEMSFHSLNPDAIGQCMTQLGVIGDHVFFGTRSAYGAQIVCYDVIAQKRVTQTSSRDLRDITDFCFHNSIAYIVLNGSFIVKADMKTGQTLSTRFETGSIGKKLCLHKETIFYCINDLITVLNGNDVSREMVLGKEIKSIYKVLGNSVYCGDTSGLLSFHVKEKKTNWEANIIAKEVLSVSAIYQNHIVEVLVVLSESGISFIRADDGYLIRSLECNDAVSMRVTGDNILVHKKDMSTMIIVGSDNAVGTL